MPNYKLLYWIKIESPGFVPSENGVTLYPNLPTCANHKVKKGWQKYVFIMPRFPLLYFYGTLASSTLDLFIF